MKLFAWVPGVVRRQNLNWALARAKPKQHSHKHRTVMVNFVGIHNARPASFLPLTDDEKSVSRPTMIVVGVVQGWVRFLVDEELETVPETVRMDGPIPSVLFNRVETVAVFLTVIAIAVAGCLASGDSVLMEDDQQTDTAVTLSPGELNVL
jgi:hypothetical protein